MRLKVFCVIWVWSNSRWMSILLRQNVMRIYMQSSIACVKSVFRWHTAIWIQKRFDDFYHTIRMKHWNAGLKNWSVVMKNGLDFRLSGRKRGIRQFDWLNFRFLTGKGKERWQRRFTVLYYGKRSCFFRLRPESEKRYLLCFRR